MSTRVRALEDRIACEITFPRVTGYRYEVPTERLAVTFTDESKLALTTEDVATITENAPIVGESTSHGRLNPRRGLRDGPSRVGHAARQVPRLARRGRHRVVGTEDGPDDGRHE